MITRSHGGEKDTLLVPLNAPRNKMAEMVDFVTAVRPRQVIPVHDGLVNETGRALNTKRAPMFAERHGMNFADLAVGDMESIDGLEPDVEVAADGLLFDDLDIKHLNG